MILQKHRKGILILKDCRKELWCVCASGSWVLEEHKPVSSTFDGCQWFKY